MSDLRENKDVENPLHDLQLLFIEEDTRDFTPIGITPKKSKTIDPKKSKTMTPQKSKSKTPKKSKTMDPKKEQIKTPKKFKNK